MKNELRCEWDLLCNDFAQAKQNYINFISPVMKTLHSRSDEEGFIPNLEQFNEVDRAWDDWVEVRNKLKYFVDKNT